jgi:hypothetical protein
MLGFLRQFSQKSLSRVSVLILSRSKSKRARNYFRMTHAASGTAEAKTPPLFLCVLSILCG